MAYTVSFVLVTWHHLIVVVRDLTALASLESQWLDIRPAPTDRACHHIRHTCLCRYIYVHIYVSTLIPSPHRDIREEGRSPVCSDKIQLGPQHSYPHFMSSIPNLSPAPSIHMCPGHVPWLISPSSACICCSSLTVYRLSDHIDGDHLLEA